MDDGKSQEAGAPLIHGCFSERFAEYTRGRQMDMEKEGEGMREPR